MNHIQKLADQAKKSVPHGLTPDKWIEVYNQKFAELIVRECAEFVKEWESYQVDMANQCHGNFPTGGDIKLKEHFGVEE